MTIAVRQATMRDHRSEARSASPWVQRFIPGAPAGSTMLDVACGSGRHLRLGWSCGLLTTGIDRDLSRVANLRGQDRIELIEADLETGAPVPFHCCPVQYSWTGRMALILL